VNYTDIKKALQGLLGKPRIKNDELQFHCPFCKHPKRKFNVNLISHAWHCWVCGAKGRSLLSLAKKLNANSNIVSLFRSLRPGKLKDKSEQDLTLPKGFIPICKGNPRSPDYMNALRYIKKRNVSLHDVLRYNIGYAESGSYSGMIIIPSYDADANLNYFTTRAFYDTEYKFLNPPCGRDIVGQELFINWSEPINIVEGTFDAISTGENTIPLFGKTLSKSLIQAIVTNKPPRINLILDNDALTMAITHAEKFLSYGLDTYIIELPGKDPNELGQDTVQQLINSTAKLTFSKLMEYKLYAN